MVSAAVKQLEEQARAARQTGDAAAAAGYWEQLLKADPEHAEAANALGMLHLSQGRSAEAVRLLSIADASDPGQPALLFNLAAAKRATGDTVGAIDALKRALEADPYFVQAMFQSGVLLEELGQLQAAAFHFKNVLDTATAEVAEDPRFAAMLARAREAVAKSNSALDQRIEQATAGSVDLPTRAREAVAILTGKHRQYTSEPTFFTVPRLPALPFFDRELTPWIGELESASDVILEEASRVIAEDAAEATSFVPYVANPPEVPSNQWAELNHSPKWGAYFFYKHGAADEANRARCPRTTDLLERMPLLRLAGRGPNAMFSLLQPGTRIPPHTGVTNIRSTVHLPLVIPPGCGFRVGAETREWMPGTAWVFDDTIEHEAWNDSDKVRLILIFDVWNPLLSADEQAYYMDVLAAYDAHMGRVPRDSDIF